MNVWDAVAYVYDILPQRWWLISYCISGVEKVYFLAKKVECHNFVYIFIYKKPLFSSNCQNFPQNTKMLWKKSPSLSTSPPILHPWWCLQLVQEVTLFWCWCYECVKWLGWALYILRKKRTYTLSIYHQLWIR